MTPAWPRVRIDSTGSVQAGRQRSVNIVDGRLRPYLRVANVYDGFINFDDVLQMPFTDREFAIYSLVPGDILINEGQSLELVGRSAIYDGPKDKYCFQNTLIRFRPSDRIHPEFAQNLFQYMLLYGVFASIASRTTSIAHLGVERFAALHIPLPPLAEQKAIASMLTTWDRRIRLLADLIAAKVRFKQGLMRQLLTGSRRIIEGLTDPTSAASLSTMIDMGLSATAVEVERGLNGRSYDEGIPKLGQCPTGWQMRRLQDLLFIVERPISLRSEETYRLVTARRYRAGIVLREVLRGDQIKTKTQFQAKEGDFLISRRQIVHGACGLVPAQLDGAVVSNEYSCLRVSDELDPVFLEYLTHTKYIQRTFFQSSVGVTVEKLIFRIENWLRYEIHLPPLAEQRRIVALLGAMDREIVLLDRLQKAIAVQKKGLMQKLLTGEVRLKLPEEAV